MNASTDYLNEIINFGGERLSRGRVIQILQAEGHNQRYIDAYMMGSKAVAGHTAEEAIMDAIGEAICMAQGSNDSVERWDQLDRALDQLQLLRDRLKTP